MGLKPFKDKGVTPFYRSVGTRTPQEKIRIAQAAEEEMSNTDKKVIEDAKADLAKSRKD